MGEELLSDGSMAGDGAPGEWLAERRSGFERGRRGREDAAGFGRMLAA